MAVTDSITPTFAVQTQSPVLAQRCSRVVTPEIQALRNRITTPLYTSYVFNSDLDIAYDEQTLTE